MPGRDNLFHVLVENYLVREIMESENGIVEVMMDDYHWPDGKMVGYSMEMGECSFIKKSIPCNEYHDKYTSLPLKVLKMLYEHAPSENE